jgi:NAD(P)-dependent dehydrogenase (short-subunit alcohol dehydrogenase family)
VARADRRPFERPGVGLVYGRQTGNDRTHFSELEVLRRWFPEVGDDDQQTPFCNNANCAVRASAWRELPYDEELTGLEDLDWAKRALAAGWKIVYEARAGIAHVHDELFADTRNRYRREGIAHRRIFHDQQTTDETWSRVMNTNVRAMFQLIRGLHQPLAATRGGIVNVSSVHAIATSKNVAAYAISKGAVASLTRTAALELALAGIRCNAVLPGAVLTPILEAGLARRPHARGPQGNLDEIAAQTPLGFVAAPDQIAPSIVFLADGRLSPYTTGQTLVVDGGATVQLSTE